MTGRSCVGGLVTMAVGFVSLLALMSDPTASRAEDAPTDVPEETEGADGFCAAAPSVLQVWEQLQRIETANTELNARLAADVEECEASVVCGQVQLDELWGHLAKSDESMDRIDQQRKKMETVLVEIEEACGLTPVSPK